MKITNTEHLSRHRSHGDRRTDLRHDRQPKSERTKPASANPYLCAFRSLEAATDDSLELRKLPLSSRNYIIFFIPRSGSGLLKTYLSATAKLGRPAEYFNIRHFENQLTRYPGSTLAEYVELIRRAEASANGIFGMKIDWSQLRHVNQIVDLVSLFGEPPQCVYLRRRDLLLQAVSLARLWQSKIAHIQAGSPSAKALQRAQTLVYRESEIARAVLKVARKEYRIEEYFRLHELNPLRIFYEDTVSDPIGVVQRVAGIVGVRLHESEIPTTPQLAKTGTNENRIWAERFRNEHWEFLDYWEANRGTVLPR